MMLLTTSRQIGPEEAVVPDNKRNFGVSTHPGDLNKANGRGPFGIQKKLWSVMFISRLLKPFKKSLLVDSQALYRTTP